MTCQLPATSSKLFNLFDRVQISVKQRFSYTKCIYYIVLKKKNTLYPFIYVI